jgi:hypothetical protein
MRILCDHGTPRGISRAVQSHIVKEARAPGWDMPSVLFYVVEST